MAMLTPTPFMMRPTSFEHLALFHNFLRNFSGLRPTLGTVLRITADIGSIWIAFLFGWLVVDGNDLAALIAPGFSRDSSADRAALDPGTRGLHRRRALYVHAQLWPVGEDLPDRRGQSHPLGDRRRDLVDWRNRRPALASACWPRPSSGSSFRSPSHVSVRPCCAWRIGVETATGSMRRPTRTRSLSSAAQVISAQPWSKSC